MIIDGRLSKGQGRALVVLMPEEQVNIANLAIQHSLNTRAVEKMADSLLRGYLGTKPRPEPIKFSRYLTEKYSRQCARFDLKVQEQGLKRKLSLNFDNEEELYAQLN